MRRRLSIIDGYFESVASYKLLEKSVNMND